MFPVVEKATRPSESRARERLAGGSWSLERGGHDAALIGVFWSKARPFATGLQSQQIPLASRSKDLSESQLECRSCP